MKEGKSPSLTSSVSKKQLLTVLEIWEFPCAIKKFSHFTLTDTFNEPCWKRMYKQGYSTLKIHLILIQKITKEVKWGHNRWSDGKVVTQWFKELRWNWEVTNINPTGHSAGIWNPTLRWVRLILRQWSKLERGSAKWLMKKRICFQGFFYSQICIIIMVS